MTHTHTNQTSLRLAGGACLVGATMLTLLAVVTQVVQASTDVSDDQWSYPWWSSGTAVTIYLFAAGSELLLQSACSGSVAAASQGRHARRASASGPRWSGPR